MVNPGIPWPRLYHREGFNLRFRNDSYGFSIENYCFSCQLGVCDDVPCLLFAERP
jgi:hypothetical protein